MTTTDLFIQYLMAIKENKKLMPVWEFIDHVDNFIITTGFKKEVSIDLVHELYNAKSNEINQIIKTNFMTKATFVKKAQKNIYSNGKHVEYTSQRGKSTGQIKTKLDRTIPRDSEDKIYIKAGESYYWWQFKNGPKKYSLNKPRRSQLTQSNYLSQIYDFQDQISDIVAEQPEDIAAFVLDLTSDLETLKDETESSYENMPDSLKEGPTGQLLQERCEVLENAISELESIDTDYDEDSDTIESWIQDKIDEIQNISLD